MIGIRQSQQAFDPGNRPLQPMRRDNPAVVSALIPGKGTEDSIYLLANLSEKSHRAVAEIPDSAQDSPLIDLIGGKQLAAISKNKIEILLGPYQAVWLQQG
ncbi:MAG: hypothetical protein DCC75_14180 [Proteobacteria bacterium]|nr:MAG: hypothetical protein DCC75_14180 [Pseudomonadota bacterium]